MSTKTRRVLQPYHWVGMDVSKPFFDAAVLSHADQQTGRAVRELPARRFARTRAGVKQFLGWVEEILEKGQDVLETRGVMEATGKFSDELAAWLLEIPGALKAAIINPQPASHFIKSLAFRNSTDRLAARGLALYGAQRRPAPYEPPSAEEAELRELSRYRHFLVKECTAMTNHGIEGAQHKAVARIQARRRREIKKDIAAIEKQMRTLVGRAEGLKTDLGLLQTIHGVGFITAVTVRAELGDLRRFERARQLSAFAGLSPSKGESGTSVRKKTRMSKTGNKQVRAVVYMAACAAVARPNPWKTYHEGLKAKGKKPMESIGAVMRKLVVLMRAILISGQPYDPRYKKGGKPNNKLVENAK